MIYRHTQPGTLVRRLLGGLILLLLALIAAAWTQPDAGFFISVVTVPVLVVLGVALLLFHSLTVEVTQERLALRFGPGPIRRSFALADIVRSRPVQNPWYYGWGIRWTPHGWLFNVSGLDAVEIELRNGRRYRVGTDEPAALHAALSRASGKE